ncbi:Uncharacterised protein [Mycobacteroides abscessus subsp. abscessus]|nr:Uncharacterised protein [Mycobacteroides abscessus subsp. abscessus]
MNTAMVRSRSLYSSMSRLMNLGVGAEAAYSYSGVRRRTAVSTTSSKDHGACGPETAETLTET